MWPFAVAQRAQLWHVVGQPTVLCRLLEAIAVKENDSPKRCVESLVATWQSRPPRNVAALSRFPAGFPQLSLVNGYDLAGRVRRCLTTELQRRNRKKRGGLLRNEWREGGEQIYFMQCRLLSSMERVAKWEEPSLVALAHYPAIRFDHHSVTYRLYPVNFPSPSGSLRGALTTRVAHPACL